MGVSSVLGPGRVSVIAPAASRRNGNRDCSAERTRLVGRLIGAHLRGGDRLRFRAFRNCRVPPHARFSVLGGPTIDIGCNGLAFGVTYVHLFRNIGRVLAPVGSSGGELLIMYYGRRRDRSIR